MTNKNNPLKVTFMGTGTSQGIPVIGCTCHVCLSDNKKDKRTRPSVYIESGDFAFCIDCGPDFRHQMLANDKTNLDFILITHEHNDHVIGLDDVRPINFKYNKEIPLYTSRRVAKDLQNRFDYIFGSIQYPGLPRIKLMEVQANEVITWDDLNIQVFEVLHGRLPVLSFKIASFAYITDANFLPEKALEHFRDCDTIVINALHHKRHHAHFNLQQALEVIEDLNPGRAYLTHMSHQMGLHDEVNATLPDGIQLSYDGLCIEV